MANIDDPPGALTPLQEAAAALAGVRTFALYAQGSLFFALLDRGAIDPQRFFAFGKTLAAGLRQNAARQGGDAIASRAQTDAADMLDELESMVRNRAAPPAGAGRA
ncbi:hypothetical protein DFR50_1259 [Roseiarcus fermentans]|uniref:Uncharacterized protein n=1 Tax=Roseiarcus fermentans TaxID=1473586 RepID=A0A366F1I7_9HYPH|nr:hypothetical protein [Roseiarcus fermentans]RBP08528.1 hypothetical protein DFR50_1259 [Roseiarcus fermentans]